MIFRHSTQTKIKKGNIQCFILHDALRFRYVLHFPQESGNMMSPPPRCPFLLLSRILFLDYGTNQWYRCPSMGQRDIEAAQWLLYNCILPLLPEERYIVIPSEDLKRL